MKGCLQQALGDLLRPFSGKTPAASNADREPMPKAPSYRDAGARENVRRQSLFHHLAVLHHRDAVADLGRDAQVVGDEDHRQAETLAQIRQEPQDLRLHRDVERRNRLVRHQHFGTQRERPREADPLPLTAGELMRIALGRLRVETHQREQFLGLAQAPLRGSRRG